MLTVIRSTTRNLPRYDHAIAPMKLRRLRFHHAASHFMTQDNRLLQRLKTNLMHIRKTNSAGCDLEKKLALPKRRPGNLLHAEFAISRHQRLHHRWLVTGHVSLITSSNTFTKQAPSSRDRERAFLHLCWSCVH